MEPPDNGKVSSDKVPKSDNDGENEDSSVPQASTALKLKGFAKFKRALGLASTSGNPRKKFKKEKSSSKNIKKTDRYALLGSESESPHKVEALVDKVDKKENSRSKLAATLVRKMSFKKIKKNKSVGKVEETKIIPAVASPSTSVEELDLTISTTPTVGNDEPDDVSRVTSSTVPVIEQDRVPEVVDSTLGDKGEGESAPASPCQVSQLEASRELKVDHEPKSSSSYLELQVVSVSPKPEGNVAALESVQSATEETSGCESPGEPQAAEDSTSRSSTPISNHTARLRADWMSKSLNPVEATSPTKHMEVKVTPQKVTQKKSKKVALAATKRKIPEAEEEQGNLEKSPEASPTLRVMDSTTSIVESTPGSSKSDPYVTPTDSPVSSSSGSLFYSPDVTVVESPQPPPGVSPLANGDDVMAEARARLSQSLGVSNSMATQNQVGDKREHLYKILVIGELGTGKTSIIKRYVHQFFSQHYRATIGVDFALKVLNWDANTIIRLQLWDIAGQERFGNMTRVYYKEAVGAFIVFDVTRAATFDAVLKWKQDLDSKVQLPDGSPIPCVLLANKCDQQKEGIVNQPGKMDEYCKERGFSGWFETSAKENINIEEAARSLVTKILQNDQVRIQSDSVKDGDKFNLDGNNLHDDKSKGKCSSC